MNRMVPGGNNLDDWYKAISSMFGDVVQCNCGAFDADLDMIPPFVTHIPANDFSDCLTFNEIKTGTCFTYKNAQIILMKLIEASINRDMALPRDTSKATIVWRIKPKINTYMDLEKNKKIWSGYARVRVLDKNSQFYNMGF